MDGSPIDSHASGSQIPMQLRQRMLNRAATFAEGTQHPPLRPRHRSSLLSNISDAQHSFRSSTDSLLRNNDTEKLDTSDEPSHLTSSPVLFALLPAIAALTHQNGAAFVTDVLLLLLAGWFMYWIVRTPWDWYHEAQQRQYIEVDPMDYDDTIPEDNEEGIDSPERPSSATDSTTEPKNDSKHPIPPINNAAETARKELKRQEMLAFAACFLSPLLGAYMLHLIRAQLTHGAQAGLISDLNLTIFILGAEVRPVQRLIKMQTEHLIHLQRIVRSDPRDAYHHSADTEALAQRIALLESRSSTNNTQDVDITKLSAEVRQATQHQLDALNRAVRKYEKRHMAQSIQIEARFQDLDLRLKDTLVLAAAAARTGNRPGVVSMTISWMTSVVNYALSIAYDIALFPVRSAVAVMGGVRAVVVGKKRVGLKRKGQDREKVNGYSSGTSMGRVQGKTGQGPGR